MDFYHLCIVGAGMIGSATARHASTDPSLRVCLIGPDEPKDWNTTEIFSAHYDEGRLTYLLEECLVSQKLTKESIARYREIEKLSGIPFYNPVGCLYIGEKNEDCTIRMQNACIINNIPVEDISHQSLFKKKFPFIHLRQDEIALFDNTGAGYISARGLVAAQQEIARKQGCVIIRDVVSAIEEFRHSNDNILLKITTDCGNIIEAQRVVICTGAFTNFRQLLPNYGILSPDMEITEDTVALLEITEDEAERLKIMPSILYDRTHYPSLLHKIGAYVLPPIRYPDGKWYLKIGHGKEYKKPLSTIEEVKKWYLSKGDPEIIKEYADILKNLLSREVEIISIKGSSCVTTHTPSKFPYIDRITPILTVAIAGNGRAAKMSDELGRLAASLAVKAEWNSDVPRSLFSIQWKHASKKL